MANPFHTPAHKQVVTPPAQVEIATPPANDFSLANHGSILVLTPRTQQAREWAERHLPEDAQRWARGIVIEPRYFHDIQYGIEDAGLTVGA